MSETTHRSQPVQGPSAPAPAQSSSEIMTCEQRPKGGEGAGGGVRWVTGRQRVKAQKGRLWAGLGVVEESQEAGVAAEKGSEA